MSNPLTRHQEEIQRNLKAWENKPLLREIYAGMYQQILALVDRGIPGRIVELGSGIGNLKQFLPEALATDIFPNPWLDLVCDAYQMPFEDRSLSHLVLFDVFHHLQAPNAFLAEARRVLAPAGRLILLEPFVSLSSFPIYGLFHHEPLGWGQRIELTAEAPRPQTYYAAQGNATRLFFRREIPDWPQGWSVFHKEAFSCFYYLLSGGYSKPALYPASWLGGLQKFEKSLNRLPRLFGGRCLVGLSPAPP